MKKSSVIHLCVTSNQWPVSRVLVNQFFRRNQRSLKQMYFVVLLPDGTIVEPRVARRM